MRETTRETPANKRYKTLLKICRRNDLNKPARSTAQHFDGGRRERRERSDEEIGPPTQIQPLGHFVTPTVSESFASHFAFRRANGHAACDDDEEEKWSVKKTSR